MSKYELEGEDGPDSELEDEGDAEESSYLRVVGVTSEASERIASKGGTLYLWQEPFAGSFVTDKAAFRRPLKILEFRTVDVADIQVLITEDLELPQELLIRRSVWPPLKLHIEWNGRTWGWRGPADGPLQGGG